MGLDITRVVASAVEAAVNGDEPQRRRRRLSGVRAVAAGAALAAAARVAVSKAPAVPRMPDLSELADDVRDRLTERGWLDGEQEEEEFDEEPAEDEGEYDEEDLEEEPEAEAEYDEDDYDEESEDEPEDDEEEPEDEASEDWEKEPEEAEDASSPGMELGTNGGDADSGAHTPDLIEVLGEHRSPPPVLRRSKARGGRQLDPAARPPEPPQRKDSKSKAGRR